MTTSLEGLRVTYSIGDGKERPPDARDYCEELWRKYRPALVMALRAKVGSIAEDIAQETYLKLLERLPDTAIRDLRNYLYTMAFNLAKDYFRKRDVVRRKLLLLENGYHENPSPEQIHLSDDALSQLEQALRQLSPECREALDLVVFMGKTADEAAKDLGVPPTTIKGRVERGLKKVKCILTGDDYK